MATNQCPDYRIRLFLSVDLVGSTAYKSRYDSSVVGGYPDWLTKFREFYRKFPEFIESAFRETKTAKEFGSSGPTAPKLWKIIGDEILFCCRVVSHRHLSCCMTSFLSALEDYGKLLDGTGLDVKGAGWVAAFPSENISLAINDGNISATRPNEEVVTEDFESDADLNPNRFDFLGRSMDTGFRVAKAASSERFAASAELAYLLASSQIHQMFLHKFRYDGRHELKGVNENRPYPVINIETERDLLKREVKSRERLLTREPDIDALPLHDFLSSFLEEAKLELPRLSIFSNDDPVNPPPSYDRYKSEWSSTLKGTQEQEKSVQQAENESNQGGDELLPTSITEFASLKSETYRNALRGLQSGYIPNADALRRARESIIALQSDQAFIDALSSLKENKVPRRPKAKKDDE